MRGLCIMGDVQLVGQIFDKLSLGDLLKCKDKLTSAINHAHVKRQTEIKSKRVEDFVKLDEGFVLDSTVYGGISADLESLNLKPNKTFPVTKWLTCNGQAYEWKANNGHTTIKNPLNIKDSKFIYDVMNEINTKYGVDMNSCLVSLYASGSVYARLHDDSEHTLDQSQPICVIYL